MIIPIGHESDTVRRLPWITFGIIAINILIHLFISSGIRKNVKAVEQSARNLVEYYFGHPYLELDPEVEKLLFGSGNPEVIQNQIEAYQNMAGHQIPTTARMEQDWLDNLAARFLEDLNGTAYRKLGYIPAERNYSGLVTHMFIHGGWLHLLGNLLLLYLLGPFIEDVWGRPIFTAFYLVMGISSAAIYGLHYPNLQGPLIGASGAIAGVMGAFLVRYLKTKITFFYFFFFARGTFEAPAGLMLPLWLALQVFNARILDTVNPGNGGGVAYWAHVWGFLLGAAVAYGIKSLKIEEKYIHSKIEAKIDTGNEIPSAVNTIIQKKNAGKHGEAFMLLIDLLKKAPSTPEMFENLWNLGTQIGIRNECRGFFISLVEKEIRLDFMDQASRHFHALKDELHDTRLNLTYNLALIEFLIGRGQYPYARQLAAEAANGINPETPPGMLLRFSLAGLKLKIPQVQRAVRLCQQHPDISNDQKELLNKKLAAVRLTPQPGRQVIKGGSPVSFSPLPDCLEASSPPLRIPPKSSFRKPD